MSSTMTIPRTMVYTDSGEPRVSYHEPRTNMPGQGQTLGAAPGSWILHEDQSNDLSNNSDAEAGTNPPSPINENHSTVLPTGIPGPTSHQLTSNTVTQNNLLANSDAEALGATPPSPINEDRSTVQLRVRRPISHQPTSNTITQNNLLVNYVSDAEAAVTPPLPTNEDHSTVLPTAAPGAISHQPTSNTVTEDNLSVNSVSDAEALGVTPPSPINEDHSTLLLRAPRPIPHQPTSNTITQNNLLVNSDAEAGATRSSLINFEDHSTVLPTVPGPISHQPTSITVTQNGLIANSDAEAGASPSTPPIYEGHSTVLPGPISHQPTSNTVTQNNPPDNSGPTEVVATPLRISIHDLILLAGLFILLAWPWIFFGVVWGLNGVQINNRVGKVVMANPQGTSFFVTLLGNIVNMIVSIHFSLAIIRFAQEKVMSSEDVTVFDVSLLLALRHQQWPWGIKGLSYLFDRTKWLAAVLVAACISAFTFVPSSTASLLTPGPFYRTAPLAGTELDFSSSSADCLEWFDANNISDICNWEVFNDLRYTNCLGRNHMVDVLESGNNNILSLLSNNSQTVIFSQLGANDGIQFLGPIRGVLPIGPNGVPAFNTLQRSPFDTDEIISYNYVLDQQGFASDVNCIYDTQSPIRYTAVADNANMVAYNATCGELGLADVLTSVVDFVVPDTNNTLTFWACKSIPTGGDELAYYIYLRGRQFYETAIENITCTLSPITPAIFPVTYQSASGIFSTKKPLSNFTNTLPGFIERVLVALGDVISEGQNTAANLVAESVITLGVKTFQLQPYQPNEQYLRLYEAMIQGIVEYETTYARLIYSTFPNRPGSCNRIVTGLVSYQVMGWYADFRTIGFLMPMTLVILAGLVALLMALFGRKRSGYKFDPSKPKALLSALVRDTEDGKPIEWENKVVYRPEVFKRELTKFQENELDDINGAAEDITRGVASNVLI